MGVGDMGVGGVEWKLMVSRRVRGLKVGAVGGKF